jgi:single-stranded-DNA-specific exonuclease
LLLETNPENATKLFDGIMELNTERSRLQKEATLEAKALALHRVDAGDRVLLVTGSWHEGILGIVAAKIADEFSRPAIVVAAAHDASGRQILRGSMRSPSPFHSLKILEGVKSKLLKSGGHQAAAGLAFLPEDFEEIRSGLQESFRELEGSVFEGPLVSYDGVLDRPPRFHEIKALELLEPLGPANPEPVFLLKNFPIGEFEILKDVHIKAKKSGTEFIGFNLLDSLQKASLHGDEVDLLVVPEISTFRFQERAQMRIQSLRPSAAKG